VGLLSQGQAFLGSLCDSPPRAHPAGAWALLGRLTDQQRSIIQERFKQTDKQLARQGLAAGYRAGEAPAAAAGGEFRGDVHRRWGG
jgi:hypothetical protein